MMTGSRGGPARELSFRWHGRVYCGRIPTAAESEPFAVRFALLERGALSAREARALYADYIALLFPDPPRRRWWHRLLRRPPAPSAADVFSHELPDVVQAAAFRRFRERFAFTPPAPASRQQPSPSQPPSHGRQRPRA